MASKFPKAQLRESKSFTQLPAMITDDPAKQKMLMDFINSVAMKKDLKFVNLLESDGTTGTADQVATMDDDAVLIQWETTATTETEVTDLDFVGIISNEATLDLTTTTNWVTEDDFSGIVDGYYGDPYDYLDGNDNLVCPAGLDGMHLCIVEWYLYLSDTEEEGGTNQAVEIDLKIEVYLHDGWYKLTYDHIDAPFELTSTTTRAGTDSMIRPLEEGDKVEVRAKAYDATGYARCELDVRVTLYWTGLSTDFVGI